MRGVAYRNAVKNMDRFGRYDVGKAIFAYRAGVNFWIFAAKTLVVVVRLLCCISQDLFVALFIAGVGSLGIKLARDAIHPIKEDPLPPSTKTEE